MTDLIIFAVWAGVWGAVALWAYAGGRDAGETPRRCRVGLWTGKGVAA